MTRQGHHIVVRREDAKRLFAQSDDAGVRSVVNQLLQSKQYRADGFLLDCGTLWDPIHRCLNDGTLNPHDGEFPLDHCILGGKQLYQGEDFEAILVRPDIVTQVAEAIHNLKRSEVRDRYFALKPEIYGKSPTEEEFEHMWNKLFQIRELFEYAADERCAILFTVER